MKRAFIFLNSVLLIFFFTSCDRYVAYSRDREFESLYPSTSMNKELVLELPKGFFGELDENETYLILTNTSTEDINFKNDYELKLYILTEEGWEDIKNQVEYFPGDLILPSIENVENFSLVYIYPLIQNGEKPSFVRVAIVGNIYKHGKITDVRVGAFFDVKIE